MTRRRSPGQLAHWCRTQARVYREAAACIRVTDIGTDRAAPLSAQQRAEWLDTASRWEARADLLAWSTRRAHERLPKVVELLRMESLRNGYEAEEIGWLIEQLWTKS